MILQALNDYYQRRQRSPNLQDRLPAFGLEEKEIHFVIEIDGEGWLVNLVDTRSTEGKKKIGQRFLVPQGVKKTSGVAANLLWNNSEYVFGLADAKKLVAKRKEGKENEYMQRLIEMQTAFRKKIESLSTEALLDPGIKAVLAFLNGLDITALESLPVWSEILATNPVISFRLHGDLELICQRPAVVAAAANQTEEKPDGVCLVSGEPAAIMRLHSPIKGIRDKPGATPDKNIVSINNENKSGSNGGQTPAFASYGKEKGFTSPVGKPATFAYTTALNHLLARDSRQRIQVGDASTVFWSEQANDLETALPDLFGEPPKDDPNRGTDALKVLYQAVQSGKFTRGTANDRFHVLGLAPNAARIAIRFWETASALDLAKRIARHFDDIKITRADYESEHLSLSALLKGSSRRKSDGSYDIPPNLGGEVMRAILEDLPYPTQLLNLAIQRCRAEQAKKNKRTGKPVHNVSYERAAVIKACLNRLVRFHTRSEKELAVSLDLTNDLPAYRLGRLFAVYERMQETASERELNKTIRDAYFGAAMSSPRSVFPRLVKLNQHHLRDIKRSRPKSAGYFDGLLREINWSIDPNTAYPAIFRLEDQGRFALGYYHQRQAFFTKSDAPTTDNQKESK